MTSLGRIRVGEVIDCPFVASVDRRVHWDAQLNLGQVKLDAVSQQLSSLRPFAVVHHRLFFARISRFKPS